MQVNSTRGTSSTPSHLCSCIHLLRTNKINKGACQKENCMASSDRLYSTPLPALQNSLGFTLHYLPHKTHRALHYLPCKTCWALHYLPHKTHRALHYLPCKTCWALHYLPHKTHWALHYLPQDLLGFKTHWALHYLPHKTHWALHYLPHKTHCTAVPQA